MTKYLAIGFWTEAGGCNTFCLSRPTDSNDMETVLAMLISEAHMDGTDIDTILLVAKGPADDTPVVIEHWSAEDMAQHDEVNKKA